MLRIFLSTFIFLFFTACTTSSILITDNKPPQNEELSTSTILKIPVPVRQHGYKNFTTTVLTNELELDDFLKKVNNNNTWNKKENFINSLTLTTIDFKKYNLLLYRITESSGSTVLAVDAPTGTHKHIVIGIGRDKPNVGTTDMAYYALAYRVAKSVKDVTFDNGLKKNVIKNKKLTFRKKSEVPKDCLEWFDGCNNCGRVGQEGDVACTEIACTSYEPFKCTKWK